MKKLKTFFYHFSDLYFRPVKFFSDLDKVYNFFNLIFISWIFGISAVVGRIDRMLLGYSIDNPPKYELGFVLNWGKFWLIILGGGAIAGLLIWLLGGLWYHFRVKLSGDWKADSFESRTIYIYSSFIRNFPVLFILIWYTFMNENYFIAYQKSQIFPIIYFVFIVWSIIVSYKAVMTSFNVNTVKARIWFLILPLIFPIFMILVMILALFMDI